MYETDDFKKVKNAIINKRYQEVTRLLNNIIKNNDMNSFEVLYQKGVPIPYKLPKNISKEMSSLIDQKKPQLT